MQLLLSAIIALFFTYAASAQDAFQTDGGEWTTLTPEHDSPVPSTKDQEVIYSKRTGVGTSKSGEHVTLKDEEGESPVLSSIIKDKVSLRKAGESARKQQSFKTRNTYDYREKPPAPLFRPRRIEGPNKHIPGATYQGDYNWLIFAAAERGEIGAISELVGRGADINGALIGNQWTPLMLSIKAANNEVVRYLIARGADLARKNIDAQTALHIAAKYRNFTALNLLLDGGASYLQKDNTGKSALGYLSEDEAIAVVMSRLASQGELNGALLNFASLNSYKGVSAALAKGADINARDKDNNTPLLIALQSNAPSNIIRLLLAHKADPMVVNKECAIAMDYAVINGDADISQLVETHTIMYELEHGVPRPKTTYLASINISWADGRVTD